MNFNYKSGCAFGAAAFNVYLVYAIVEFEDIYGDISIHKSSIILTMKRSVCVSAILAFGFAMIGLQGFSQLDQIGSYNRYIIEKWDGQFYRVGPFKVKGSPFLFGKPYPGRIGYDGHALSKNETILYDVYEQKVGPDMNGKIFEADKEVTEFELFDQHDEYADTLRFVNGSMVGSKGKTQYYQLLGGGDKVAFLKSYRLRVVADPSNMMDKDMKIFEMYDEHFIYSKEDGLKKVRMSEKDIMKALAKFPEAAKLSKGFGTSFNSEKSIGQFIAALSKL